ncbi:4-hydroxybenzoate octaprenyltransferase [Arcobacter defluvii]|uniref:4-hydroxybenzoate polyprenyltransferase n=2 Tax=Arcobacteraceae TaxID=2808963 RepID=A0AAE7E669_9BACT|nr:4-hydroxybenzoate octaprenyltransferase [Arcobacter defluvii]
MFKHSIFSLPFIFIAMVVSANGWFGFKLLVLGILAALTARNFAMGFNRFLDRDIDALNPRTINRPNVDGRISPTSMFIFVSLNALGFVVVAYFVNDLALYLSVPILIIIGSYSYFKRFSYFAHIILGISLGLAPIAGVVAVSETIPLWSIVLSIGVMFWVAGFDLLYSLQDIEVDKKLKLHSIPSKFGVEKTMLISKVFHILTVVFWLLFVIFSDSSYFAYLAVILSAIMLSYEHYLVNKDFRKIDKAFFTVNGYLGIIFFILIVMDNIFF